MGIIDDLEDALHKHSAELKKLPRRPPLQKKCTKCVYYSREVPCDKDGRIDEFVKKCKNYIDIDTPLGQAIYSEFIADKHFYPILLYVVHKDYKDMCERISYPFWGIRYPYCHLMFTETDHKKYVRYKKNNKHEKKYNEFIDNEILHQFFGSLYPSKKIKCVYNYDYKKDIMGSFRNNV